MLYLSLFISCSDKQTDSAEEPAYTYPSPMEMLPLRGSEGPQVAFDEEDLWQNCAPLYGGEDDGLHHNLIIPYRGHLVMPWVPEWGRGGLSFFDMSDPCNPQKEGEGFHERMRESHAIGFMHLPDGDPHAGEYAVTTGVLGIQFWDIADLSNIEMINYMEIEGVFYPDSYTRVVLSLFWQYPYVYIAAADNGIYIVDATNPRETELVNQYVFDPPLRTAGVFALGNTLFVSSAEGMEAALLDISNPTEPQALGGGRFNSLDADGEPRESYHANLAGSYALFAQKEGGGGVMIHDISDPNQPTHVSSVHSPGGNSGYVFYDEGYLFLGDSHWAKVYDARDIHNIQEIGTGYLAGDLDTITPYGNVAILSVDDDAEDEIASVVMPWHTDIDLTGPLALFINPPDGSENVPTSSRIGIGFNEMVEPTSIFPGSVQLIAEDGTHVEGWAGAQENTAFFTPKQPLQPGTSYTFQVLAGGARDVNNNSIEETVTSTFRTAGTP
ncbi:MAG: Ig-like domain-containing protein [Myxococcota bacterium]|nr:Ig-like domain-containing protein [Myxococcota bacterium]